MAHITIACAGTLGDHLPYIALGQGLHERGHTVRLACRTAMHDLARQVGLQVYACGQEFDDHNARQHAHDWDEWSSPLPSSSLNAGQHSVQDTQERLQRELPATYLALAQACEGVDLLVAGMQRQIYAALLARNSGQRWVAASVTPAHQCATQGQHTFRQQPTLMQPFLSVLDAICQDLKLHPIDWTAYDRIQPHALLGASAWFAPTLPLHTHYQTTGFWFHHPPQASAWVPPDALRSFVARYPRPLYLSFSSIPLANPAAMLNLHARASALLGLGLVVQRGAAGFDASLLAPDVDANRLHFVDFMPPDWLLCRVGAVLHHGGVGTLARALLNGCPMLIQPLGNDQFFNAQRVLALQVGAVAHPHCITPEGLAQLLAQRVLDANTRTQAQALGSRLRAENGVAHACDLLEQWLTTRPTP